MSDTRRPQLVYRPPFSALDTIDLAHDEAPQAIHELDKLDLVVLAALLERSLATTEAALDERIGR